MEFLQTFLGDNPIIELGAVSLILVLSGYIMKSLKQPVLIGYILGGLLLGPQVFDIIQNKENIAFYAHFGVSLLLFMVGLGLNPTIVKEVGKVASIAGVGQVIFTFLLGFGVSTLLGFNSVASLFIAIALTFSSTIVIVKLISDRGDTSTTYGKVSLGVLIIQDIIAMIVLLLISATTMQAGETITLGFIMRIGLSIVRLLGFARFSAKHILPKVTKTLAQENELLLLFVISWAILFGGMRYYTGFTMEIGALLAGVTLANSRYRFHIASDLRPFRDFFLALFFVYLGGQIVFDSIGQSLIAIIVFSALVLVGNPLIIIFLMKKLGFGNKESFMTGLTVAQISEFSFIIVGLALSAGIISDQSLLSMITIVGLITMTGSSYMFANAESIYKKAYPLLTKFISHTKSKNNTIELNTNHQKIVVFGFGRLGKFIASQLTRYEISFRIIDNDIKKIHEAEKLGYNAIYGDANDNAILESILQNHAELVCSTLEDFDTNQHIITYLKENSATIRVIVTALYIEESENHYENSADYVILPHVSGAKEGRSLIEKHIRHPEQFFLSKIKSRESIQQHKSRIITARK